MLEAHKLTKSMQGKKILKEISFKAPRGEVSIFLGGSGAGKSTLLRILNNLEGYDSGEFKLDDRPLDLSQIHFNHTIGMVFQQFNLFDHLNVEENITLALLTQLNKTKEEAHQIASGLLKRFGLLDKATQPIQQLSGGQKQRLAIARTLALNPQILCLDEPTSALDPLLTTQMAGYIHEFAAENKIILLTTHDLGLVKQLKGTLYLMHEGSIIECISTEDYRNNPQNHPELQKFLMSV